MSKEKVPYPVQPISNSITVPITMPSAPSGSIYPLLNGNEAPPPYSDSTQRPSQINVVTSVPPSVQTTVYVTQAQRPTIFPSKPIEIQCWYCLQNIKTRTVGHSNCVTWLLCGLLCGIG